MTPAVLGLDLLPWGLLAATVALYVLGVLALAVAGRGADARAMARFVPDCAVLIKRLAANPATSRLQRLALLALALYLLSPLDLVPDFIPLAGYADDVVIVGLALGWLLRTHGEGAIRAAWPGPEESLRVVMRAAPK